MCEIALALTMLSLLQVADVQDWLQRTAVREELAGSFDSLRGLCLVGLPLAERTLQVISVSAGASVGTPQHSCVRAGIANQRDVALFVPEGVCCQKVHLPQVFIPPASPTMGTGNQAIRVLIAALLLTYCVTSDCHFTSLYFHFPLPVSALSYRL